MTIEEKVKPFVEQLQKLGIVENLLFLMLNEEDYKELLALANSRGSYGNTFGKVEKWEVNGVLINIHPVRSMDVSYFAMEKYNFYL